MPEETSMQDVGLLIIDAQLAYFLANFTTPSQSTNQPDQSSQLHYLSIAPRVAYLLSHPIISSM